MKYTLKNLFFVLLASAAVTACVPDEDPITYTQADLVRPDALLSIKTPVISFVAGNADYTMDIFSYIPPGDATARLDVFSVFTDASTGQVSNEVLLTSFTVAQGENNLSGTITYADLKAGLMVGGASLPDNEVDVAVGSRWNLSVRPVDASGAKTLNPGSILVAVLSPFAGIYEVIESAYYRIGAGPTIWNGQQRFIGSVDANTFSHDDYWGNFAATGFFVFDLNEDNTITIPDNLDQLFFSGTYMLTCQEDAALFTNVPCDGSNVLIVDGGGPGKHIIKLTYGYFSVTGDENEGAREFYEVLQKVVD
jgi:hypothetical protein